MNFSAKGTLKILFSSFLFLMRNMTPEKPSKLPRSQTKIATEPRVWGSLSLFLLEKGNLLKWCPVFMSKVQRCHLSPADSYDLLCGEVLLVVNYDDDSTGLCTYT